MSTLSSSISEIYINVCYDIYLDGIFLKHEVFETRILNANL